MFITWIAKVVAAFNANTRPVELGFAAAWAFLLALIPAGNLTWITLFVLAFFIKHNTAVFFTLLAVLKTFSWTLDPVLDNLGYWILTQESLGATFTTMANTPILPWTGFDQTLVMGGLALGLLSLIPVSILFTLLVRSWRFGLRDKIAKTRVVQALYKFPLINSIVGFAGKIGKAVQEIL